VKNGGRFKGHKHHSLIIGHSLWRDRGESNNIALKQLVHGIGRSTGDAAVILLSGGIQCEDLRVCTDLHAIPLMRLDLWPNRNMPSSAGTSSRGFPGLLWRPGVNSGCSSRAAQESRAWSGAAIGTGRCCETLQHVEGVRSRRGGAPL
jgi:hypothetical protein